MTLEEVLKNDKFPVAIDPMFITDPNSESDKNTRVQAILDLWLQDSLEGKKILDFGCGEGHLVEEITKRGAKAFGYDIAKIPQRQAGIFSNNWEEIVSNGPYDIIVFYDVLDHTENQMPPELLVMAKKVLAEKGTMRIRCHPWCSRHGTHLFHKQNKAFLHLLFSGEELRNAGITGPRTIRVIHPIATYQTWISKAGCRIVHNKVYRRDFEPMFRFDPYRSKILDNWQHSHIDASLRNRTGFPDYAMDQEFLDYTLIGLK